MITGLLTGMAGLIASRILFYQFPRLRHAVTGRANHLSVVIPARNEANTLPELLGDLERQTVQPLEVLCVDDDSTDATAQVAGVHGARVICSPARPEGWLGKTWACETGFRAARGEVILFLDADVRLAPDALASLMAEFGAGDSVLSVQPYHSMPAGYEQLSLFFNALQFGANGAALPRPRGIGLFGPVILTRKSTLAQVGGFTGVRSSVVEDLALGERLRTVGFQFRLSIGDPLISFRMYRDGFRSFLEGWTKNFATGAARTPVWLFFLVFVWVMGCASVPFRMIRSAAVGDWGTLLANAPLYVLWGLELRRIASRIGSFRPSTIAAYPVSLAVFLWVFAISFAKKALRLPVRWKGRDIGWEK